MNAADAYIALATAAVVVSIFTVALFAQSRRVAAPAVVLSNEETAAGFEGVLSRLTTFETSVAAEMKAMTTEIVAIKGRQQHNDHDVNNIRTMLQALPSKDAVHRLEVELTKVAGEVESSAKSMMATQRSLERIEDFILSQAKGQRE